MELSSEQSADGIININKRQNSSPDVNQPKRYILDSTNLIANNPYYLPPQLEKDKIQSDPTENTQQSEKIKIPPIFLHNANNYQKVVKDITENIKGEFITAYKGNNLRINLNNIDDYRQLTKYYDTTNIGYHTFHNPATANLSVVIRGIPTSLSDTEINQQLLEKQYPVIKVVRLLDKNKKPMPLCVVELKKGEKGEEIFNLTRLCYCVVTVEPRHKSRNIPQCTNCQLYNHTKNYCKLPPRCVKCTGQHHYTKCPKTPQQKPQCVNCGEEHTANYKGCSYYGKIKSASQNMPTNINIATNNDQANNKPTSRRVTPNLSYSNITRNQQGHPTSQQCNQSSDDTIKTILQMIFEYITPHIDTIKSFFISLLPTLINNGK